MPLRPARGRMRSWIAALILIAVCASLLYALRPERFAAGLRTTPLMEQEALWRDRIQRVGGDAAYKDFQKAEEGVDVTMQHQYAHVFGTALYDALGPRGATVCDMQFQFGCLHAFFGHLIAGEGVSGLSAIANECAQQTGTGHPCEHALGHGFLSYYGYNESGLQQALALCSENFTSDPVNGCTGGAFMEYNLYTSIGLTTDVRDAQKDGWYSPCDHLADAFQQSCYWWLPQWWHEYLLLSVKPVGSAQERFAAMGALCDGAPTAADRRACFEKIGQLTVWDTNFDVDGAIALCHAATGDPAHLLECRSYLAYIENYYRSDLEKALSACDGLADMSRRFCEVYARHDRYIPNDLPLPEDL